MYAGSMRITMSLRERAVIRWSRSASIAMGDSKNDIDMMKFAGISIAMGNSPDRIKELCDDVTAPALEAGVAVALEKYVIPASGKKAKGEESA